MCLGNIPINYVAVSHALMFCRFRKVRGVAVGWVGTCAVASTIVSTIVAFGKQPSSSLYQLRYWYIGSTWISADQWSQMSEADLDGGG